MTRNKKSLKLSEIPPIPEGVKLIRGISVSFCLT